MIQKYQAILEEKIYPPVSNVYAEFGVSLLTQALAMTHWPAFGGVYMTSEKTEELLANPLFAKFISLNHETNLERKSLKSSKVHSKLINANLPT